MIDLLLLAVTALTSVRDAYPASSPDGSLILFQSNRSGRQGLWVARPDGSNPRILFDEPKVGADPATPQWSPDGKRIVFAMRPAGATDENESEIYAIDPDGSHLDRLTYAAGDDSHPHWSANGKRIFFNSARATPDLKADWGKQWIDIYSMAAAGSDVRRVTYCHAICTYPWPSPDGRWIVHRRVIHSPGYDWSQQSVPTNSEVFITSADGSSTRNLSSDAHFDGWPIWSPDGRWIVWASGRDGVANSAQLYRVHPDGSGLERLTSGPFAHVQPNFAGPDAMLVYQEMEDGVAEIGGIARVSLPRPGQ